MADSQDENQSTHETADDEESPSLGTTTHQSSRNVSPGPSTDILRELSAGILQAIEELDMEKLCNLGRDQIRPDVSEQSWVEEEDLPSGYKPFPGEVIERFSLPLHQDYEDRIVAAASIATNNELPIHQLINWMNDPRATQRWWLVSPINILGGFRPGSRSRHWREKDSKGKNALHLAASGQGPNSDPALCTLLESIAMSTSEGSMDCLDDQTEPEHETALHLAALNTKSNKPFERLLYAGANPWVKNLNGETVLHYLVRLRDLKDDDSRFEKTKIFLEKTKNWKPLVAVNNNNETAMSLALSRKDYEMVIALDTALRAQSFVLEGDDAERWQRDGACAFNEAVLNLDASLDPFRWRLIHCLAKDDLLEGCFTRKDQSGLTALHKACNLDKDRFDIVQALLSADATNVHERARQPAHDKQGQNFANWSALKFATRRGHSSTVLVLLEKGIMGGLTSAEWAELKELAYDAGNTYIVGLLQHFRTYDSASLKKALEHDPKSSLGKDLMLYALKWPRKEMRSQGIEKKGWTTFSEYRPKTVGLEDFDYCSYPERRLIHNLVHGDEGASWNTWTKKNGGWIHLPANNWKWFESICRSSYINEEKFPKWLQSHFDQPSMFGDWRPSPFSDWRGDVLQHILRDTYMNQGELRKAFPQIYRAWHSTSSSPTSFPGFGAPSGQPFYGHQPPEDEMRRHTQLSIECQKSLAFIQDVIEVYQNGAMHVEVKQGFRSLVVRRQEQPVESIAPNMPGQEPKPGPAGLDSTDSIKSVVLPILDVDWMLSYLKTSDNGNQEPTPDLQASEASDMLEEKAYRTRADESKAIVNEDTGVLPDRREDEHWKHMEKLFDTFKEIQKPLSLDQYFHHDLKDGEVQERTSSQVVSRFIHYQHQSHKSEMRDFLNGTADPPKDIPQCYRGFHQATAQHANPGWDLERGPDVELRKAESPRQQILVVPQLWIFTIDNTVVTSFPDRWDDSNVGSSLSSCISNRVQAQPRSIDANRLLHQLLECSMQHNPSFPVCGKRFTYDEAFSGEIRRLSRKIEQSYEDFHRFLGESDEVFLDAFQTPTYCLRTIDDVLRELSMIKRVYQDQARVWEDFHNAASPEVDPLPDSRKCPYSVSCDPKVLPQRLLTKVSNLVDEAKIVQESAVTLLTLLQGEAGTENTIRTSQQSRILGVFTAVTAPLSWIAAVFALQVQGTTWTWLNVFGGSFGSMMVTLFFCAVGWLWLDWKNVKAGLRKD